MKKTTLTEIRKSVEAAGGTYTKRKHTLNGNDAYEVNGKVYTKQQLMDAYLAGTLGEDDYSDPYCDCGERLHYDPDNDWELSNCNKCSPP